jgi:ectoine hydroxylase-related dioxygenase (phytanoyl-CoA dioxygenase family)
VSLIEDYESQGYLLCENFFPQPEIKALEEVLLKFHEAWKLENNACYEAKAVNSAYLTGTKILPEEDRIKLFRFICQDEMYQLALKLIPAGPAFMNTQLFFNPTKIDQKNYWHRDIQYSGMSIEQQQESFRRVNVIHFRVPVRDEPGMELVPGSHAAWDTDEESEVRLERSGHLCSQALSTGVTVPLKAGDLLVFSANMIHRGLYGGDRLSFDILFCDQDPELLAFADADCLPDDNQLHDIPNSSVLSVTSKHINKS